MGKENHIHHEIVRCPECGREIVLALAKVKAITIKEYQEWNKELLKRIHAEDR